MSLSLFILESISLYFLLKKRSVDGQISLFLLFSLFPGPVFFSFLFSIVHISHIFTYLSCINLLSPLLFLTFFARFLLAKSLMINDEILADLPLAKTHRPTMERPVRCGSLSYCYGSGSLSLFLPGRRFVIKWHSHIIHLFRWRRRIFFLNSSSLHATNCIYLFSCHGTYISTIICVGPWLKMFLF